MKLTLVSAIKRVAIVCFVIVMVNVCAFAQIKPAKALTAADSLNDVKKYKIKSVTTLSYTATDSTFKNADLEYKYKVNYDRVGNSIESYSENKNGKKMQRSESKFNSQNLVVENISYDSLNVVNYSSKIKYDIHGNVSETESATQMSIYTYKSEDANKYMVYTERNRYDVNQNLIEFSTDSAGTQISKTLQQYDDKNRLVSMTIFTKGFITMKEVTVYDSKGAKTVTNETFEMVSPNQCGPAKNKTVQKFDVKGNMISYVTTSDDNGSVYTTKTSSDYKYDKDLIISVKTVTETTGEGYSSKTTNTESYKYDKNGNVLESSYKYGGGGGNSITKSKYNDKNSIIESVSFYGTCTDKPSSITTYKYTADGVTLKESITETFDYPSKSIMRNDEKGLRKEDYYNSERDFSHNVYQYEFWD